ncbi:MAG: nucleotidyl transferase AbiEii/AbiGii toxin family protein [Anaerolineales bacterium]|jgi:predicted nucleotidyltransferase component of viral defense system|nr:nucleotidyl transferase AbiEii/AbiGii toxin family protein [Anaerolineales bacterium]
MSANNTPITGKGLLTSIQRSFLTLFSQLQDQNQFYLTGGTALAEYYLGHRLSFDLDFFTGVDGLILPASYQIEKRAEAHGLQITVTRRFATYVEFLLSDEQDSLKIDLALDSPFRFEPPVPSTEGIWVNNYQDLIIDKLLAYYGRAEPRDAVDLYFILQNSSIEALIEKARAKDPGFDLYWFVIALNRSSEFPDELDRWPVKMISGFDPVKLKADFQKLAFRFMDQLKKS